MPCAKEIFLRDIGSSAMPSTTPNLTAVRIYPRKYAVPVGLIRTKGYSVLQTTPVTMLERVAV
jgi:hypothetical protein